MSRAPGNLRTVITPNQAVYEYWQGIWNERYAQNWRVELGTSQGKNQWGTVDKYFPKFTTKHVVIPRVLGIR